MAQQVKDLTLLLLRHGFSPWPRNPHAVGVAKKNFGGSSCCGAAETNPTRNHEVSGSKKEIVHALCSL